MELEYLVYYPSEYSAKMTAFESKMLFDPKFLGSLLFHFNWLCENIMVLCSLIVFFLIPIHVLLFAITRKRALVRNVIMLVQLKLLSYALNYYFPEVRPPGACVYSDAEALSGPSDAGIQISGFFICQLMHYISYQERSIYAKNQDSDFHLWQVPVGILAYLIYNTKIYFREANE